MAWDVLQGMVGRKRKEPQGVRWEFVRAEGHVGGTHYALSECGNDGFPVPGGGTIVVPNTDLEAYTFFQGYDSAKAGVLP